MLRHRFVGLFLVLSALLLSGCGGSTVDTATSADGIPIKYEVTGDGKVALLFIHGWTANRELWDDQAKHFKSDYQVVRIDLAGHGDSGSGRKVYSVAAFGADVAAVADKLGLKRVVLIGHSMGGPVA